ncbi:hypothetical protein M0R04_09015 [Candidatus Dojkabacteria bacterium]|jgi:hypothetical protein|nr:hypothetical protein [Candidatus Dojkabacteria bacterium]
MVTNTLDQILNIVVPIGAFIFLGFVIYKGFKDPIDDFLGWIKGLFTGGGGNVQQEQGGYSGGYGSGGYSGRTKRNPFGMDSTDIAYR